MDYDYREKKTVIVVRSDLETGVAMNVVGHLALTIGHGGENIMGRDVLMDASHIEHRGISRYPVIITKAKRSKIRGAIEKARNNTNIIFADYPMQMLETGHDDELAEALEKCPEPELEYLGAIFYGESREVDEITGKFSLYR